MVSTYTDSSVTERSGRVESARIPLLEFNSALGKSAGIENPRRLLLAVRISAEWQVRVPRVDRRQAA